MQQFPIVPPAAEYQEGPEPPTNTQIAEQTRLVHGLARVPPGYQLVDADLADAKKKELRMLQHGSGIAGLTQLIGLSFSILIVLLEEMQRTQTENIATLIQGLNQRLSDGQSQLENRINALDERLNAQIGALSQNVSLFRGAGEVVQPVKVNPGLLHPPPVSVTAWRTNLSPERCPVGSRPSNVGVTFPVRAVDFFHLTMPQVCEICHFYCDAFGIVPDDNLVARQEKLFQAFVPH